ncbi:MAG TPA: ammonia-forming cytochrome c nitrite reductase subunit c552 [Vulgatibacter sp.]|nr:ammonia-forming cytochrome c nitrite reductase subunit c552 [Vulgatibacter sp.]
MGTGEPGKQKRSGRAMAIAVVVIAAGTAAGTSALLVNIFERKAEARTPFFRVVELDEKTVDPAEWGKNFPLQYDSYLRTTDMVRTRFGGSEAMPRTPTDADPRSIVARSKVEDDGRLARMWAGYAFSVDYRQKRGHAYMLEDQEHTRRVTEFEQPGTCLHCHASIVDTYREAGGGDMWAGFEKINQMPYHEARKHVEHPIACLDCHDPKTMQLRVTRPGFLEGIRALKASEGIADYDPNTMATRQEMRSYVCGQCHVEYYFEGPKKRIVYPWAKGLKIEDILDYYEEIGFTDFVHAETGTHVLKAQHPEFEMWNQGIHARSGVSCTDCHMPYQRVGAMKVTDHHVRSPMLNVNRACQTCHKWSEAELQARVETIQERTVELRGLALDALMDLIDDLKAAKAAGRPEPALEEAKSLQRRAQMMIDFVESENSSGFHAPQESARILAKAIDSVRKAQRALGDAEPAAVVADD